MKKDKYYPLPPNVTIKESEIHGLGLFSTDIISAGTNLGLSHIKNIEYQHGMIRTPLGGFVNHTEEPNCELIDIGPDIYLITTQDIMPEEELTLKYKTYEI